MGRKCPTCGFSYLPEEPEDRKMHRSHHRRVVELLDPKPVKNVSPNTIVEVRGICWEPGLKKTPRWMDTQMYQRAWFFRREFRYDFVLWDAKGEDSSTTRGILFIDEQCRIVGAASFRWRNWIDATPGWALQWIWFTPKYRRQGYLARHWKQLRETYGDFFIEPPVSEAMRAFVRKQGDDKLLPQVTSH